MQGCVYRYRKPHFASATSRVKIAPQAHQHLLLSVFLISAVLIGVQNYLVVFTFPCWLLMSSVFSCAYWPLIGLCELCLQILTHFFNSAFCLMELQDLFMYYDYQSYIRYILGIFSSSLWFAFSFSFLSFFLDLFISTLVGGRAEEEERHSSRHPSEHRAWCGALSYDPQIITWA